LRIALENLAKQGLIPNFMEFIVSPLDSLYVNINLLLHVMLFSPCSIAAWMYSCDMRILHYAVESGSTVR
jgi:hypothetical protein